MEIRVILVDDHTMMREGLRALLAGAADIHVVGEARDGRAALDLLRGVAADVAVMDVGMPELNGIEATRRIRAEYPNVKVVALSTHADGRYVFGVLDAGACGYVSKMADHDELLRAVRAASLGRSYLSPEVAGMVVDRLTQPPDAGNASAFSALGSREREVLQLIAEGKTSAEAARTMHISVKTVETHRRNIATKLKLRGTAELTKYAVREGLTALES